MRVRREWMYAAADAAQRVVAHIAFPTPSSPTNIREYLVRVIPPTKNDLEHHVLEGLIARAEREARERPEDAYSPLPQPLALRVDQLLRQRYSEPWTIAQLAHELATNHSTLTAEFKKVFGITIHDRLVAYRVYAAKGRLGAGEKAAAVAFDVGFRSTKTLYSAFLRITGERLRKIRAANVLESPSQAQGRRS